MNNSRAIRLELDSTYNKKFWLRSRFTVRLRLAQVCQAYYTARQWHNFDIVLLYTNFFLIFVYLLFVDLNTGGIGLHIQSFWAGGLVLLWLVWDMWLQLKKFKALTKILFKLFLEYKYVNIITSKFQSGGLAPVC